MFRSSALVFSTAITVVFLLIPAVGQAGETVAEDKANTPTERAALAAVAKRIDGFNSYNLAAYLAAHQENVRIYEYPDKAIGDGRSHLKRIFGPLLEQGIGRIDVQKQVAIANTVVSEENISYGGDEVRHIVAIYTVHDGLISSYRLIESPD